MELNSEQEMFADQQVQLIHDCLSGIKNEYFYSSVRPCIHCYGDSRVPTSNPGKLAPVTFARNLRPFGS